MHHRKHKAHQLKSCQWLEALVMRWMTVTKGLLLVMAPENQIRYVISYRLSGMRSADIGTYLQAIVAITMTPLEETAPEVQVNTSCHLKPVFENDYDIPMDVDAVYPIEEDRDEDEDNAGEAEEEAEGHTGGEADSMGMRSVRTTTQVGLMPVSTIGTV
jgi:hypothetical protein